MVDAELLNRAIERSGLKKGYLAELLGLTRAGFANKVYGRKEFTGAQIKILSDALKLNVHERDIIFFS